MTALPLRTNHALRSQNGTATVELVLILPLLLTLCAFIMAFGQLYWTQNVLQKAAQEGARALSMAPAAQFGSSMPGIEAQLLQDIRSAGVTEIQASDITLTCLDMAFNPFAAAPAYCVPGSSAPADSSLGYVQTIITLPFANLGSWLPFYFPLNATALYRYGYN